MMGQSYFLTSFPAIQEIGCIKIINEMVFSLSHAIHCSIIVHRKITEDYKLKERKKGGAMNRMGCAVQNEQNKTRNA